MIKVYRDLFMLPESKGLVLAGLLARIPLPMIGIGIITMLAQLRGSYGLSGLVSAAFVLTYALLSPQISRLVDKYGQSRILPSTTIISVIGLVVLAKMAAQGPIWGLYMGAFLAGFMPSISAMVRARWAARLRGQTHLATAHSLETVLDELSFIIGPPLSIGLAVSLFPEAGLMIAGMLLVAGVAVLVLQRATEPLPSNGRCLLAKHGSALRIRGVQLLTLVMIALGIIVGTVDIVSVAFAQAVGYPAAASIVLSAYGLGSCISGLIFGALRVNIRLTRLLILSAFATALTTLPLLWVTNIPALVSVVLMAGVFFAPTMIVAMSLINKSIPEHQQTEAITWLLAGLNIGVALGAALSGQRVDESGASAGFIISIGAGVAVLLFAGLTYRILNDADYRSSHLV